MRQIYHHWRFDMVHANFGSPDGIAAAFLARRLHLTLIITEHQAKLAEFLTIPYLKRQYSFAYHTARKVICVSHYTASLITSTFRNVDNVKVISNGVDFSRFHLRELRDYPERLIYIGYLVHHKGIHILLRSLAMLKAEGIAPLLSIIGDGEYRNELCKLATELNLNDQVSFIGEKTPTEVAEILPEHDLMVHPSFIESFGIVMVEALACGLPVLSTFNGGAEEIVNDNNGRLVAINNPGALADGIKEIFSNWQQFDPHRIRAQAQERFDLLQLSRRVCDLYQEVLCQP